MKEARNIRARQFRFVVSTALALAMLMLGGCQSAPRAETDGHRAVAMFAAVMSPGGHVCEPIDSGVATGATTTPIEFVPMFAAASTNAFSPVRIDLAIEESAASSTVDTGGTDETPQFLPMFACINSPARWSARLVLDESAIVNDPKSREGARR